MATTRAIELGRRLRAARWAVPRHAFVHMVWPEINALERAAIAVGEERERGRQRKRKERDR